MQAWSCREDCVGVGSRTESGLGQTSCVYEYSFLHPQKGTFMAAAHTDMLMVFYSPRSWKQRCWRP